MDRIGHYLTFFSLWAMPLVWVVIAWVAWSRNLTSAAICFLVAGLSGLIWCFLELPVGGGPRMWQASTYVDWEDAPIGHILTVYLPLVSKVSLVVAVALVLRFVATRAP